MAKYAKIYNKDTKEWEILNPIPVSDVPSGTTNASNVIVNNPYYADENGNDVDLNEALTDISDSIYELRRNVSWLAEHKGTGGGGGGGVIVDTDYKIEVAGLKEGEKNVLDIVDSTLEINFKINNAKNAKFEYNVYYDGKVVKSGSLVGSQTVYVKGKLSENKNEHTLTITAVDEYGNDVPTYNAIVIERSISISTPNKTISCSIDGDAVIDIDIKNSIMGGRTSLVFSCDKNNSGKDYIYTYENFYTGTHREKVYWRNILNAFGMLVKPGYTYNVTVYADDTIAGKSKPITFKMVMVSPDTLTVIVSNGLAEIQEESESCNISYNSSLSFSFIAYKTNEERNPFYAVKIEHFNDNTGVFENQKLISGVYFGEDSELNVAGKTYKDNNTTKYTVEQNITEKLTKDTYGDYKGVNKVTVKCWTSDGQYTGEAVGYFVLSVDNMVFLDFVNPMIGNGRYACLARWDKEDSNRPSTDKETLWTSTRNDYYYFSDPTKESVSVDLQMFNVIGLGYNGYVNNRLQFKSNAYGVVDLSEHSSEIRNWLGSTYQQCSGFTISLTFNAMDLPDTNKVVFFAGSNDSTGKLANGIKITLDTVTWKIGGQELVYRIRPTHLYTIDFVYDKVNGLAKLFIDGKVSQGASVQINNNNLNTEVETYKKLYLGCDVIGGNISNKSSVYVYNLSIFSHSVPDDGIVINGKNARILDYSSEEVKEDYIEWKNNNLFVSERGVSLLYNSSDGYLNPSFDELVSIAPVSVLEIEAVGDNNGFTYDYFTDVTGKYTEVIENIRYRFRYIDRKNNIVSEDSIIEGGGIKIQGTSTTGYRSKNLEMYTDSLTAEHPKLWQVKEDWFPEFEYTLKADVMDSSHANNAVVGKWINDNAETFGMEKNPAQMAMDYQVNGEYVNRPIKTNYAGEPVVENGVTIRHLQPKVKHTIEGFPVIVLAKFYNDTEKDANGKEQQVTRFLGIYSFNLGRYSHYNLGLKFLKSYSTEDNSGKEFNTPCVVTSYEEHPITANVPVDGDNYTRIYYGTTDYFHLNDVYSYEFSEAGDMNDVKHPSWSQSDKSVIKHIGDFNFNGSTESGTDTAPESAWDSLKKLFDVTDALCYYNYNIKDKYIWNGTSYISSGEKPVPSDNTEQLCIRLNEHLSFNNTSVYFTICVALGLTDSLGKNFTLRTWGSDMWYPTFYDLDTALGLNNSGGENIMSTEYIDKFVNRGKYLYSVNGIDYYTDNVKDVPEGVSYKLSPNIYQTIFNSSESKYSSFNSKIWDIFRNEAISKYLFNANSGYKTYADIWSNLRKNKNKLLDTSSSFVALMENQMLNCGELLFNADYYFKYISKYKKPLSDVATYGDIGMLHGDRIEYVRKWLNERLNFFDGIFLPSFVNSASEFTSNFFNKVSLGGLGKSNDNCILTITTNNPMFITAAMQNANDDTTGENYIYYVPKNTPTEIVLFNFSGNNGRQFLLNASDVITNIQGLQDVRLTRIITGTLPKLSTVDIENIDSLETDPFNFGQHFVFMDNETGELVSNINTLKFKGAKKGTVDGGSKFNLNVKLTGNNDGIVYVYDKIDYIDISNSDVTNLELPEVPISKLIVNNSKIPTLNLVNQPIIDNLNLAGCNSLTTLTIENCDNLSEINLSNLKSLETVTISECSGLKTIICKENTNLINFIVKDCESLESIDLTNCINDNLTVSMSGNIGKLTSVVLSNTKCESVHFPAPEYLDNVKNIDLSYCNKLKTFTYDKYTCKDNVLDLTPFTNLGDSNGLSLLNNTEIEYVKVGTPDKYFKVGRKTISGFERGLFQDMVNLKRVYGYIELCSHGLFSESSKFKLNESYTISDEDKLTKEFKINPYSSNGTDFCTFIKFNENVSNAYNMFKGTMCSPHDILYVLKFVDNVANINGMFSECYNTGNNEHINYRYAFSHCTNVVDINDFMYCKNQANSHVYLYSTYIDDYGVNRYNGTFSFLKNVKELNRTFAGHKIVFDNSDTLYNTWLFDDLETPDGENLKIEVLNEFSIDEIVLNYTFKSCNLFKNLPNLKQLTHCFRDTNISIVFNDGLDESGNELDSYKGCEIFYNNTKLEVVANSFVNLYAFHATPRQEFTNMFGGDFEETKNDLKHYPRKLKRFENNFSFKTNDEGVHIRFEIGDNTLSTLTELEYLTGTLDYHSFNGNAVKKVAVGKYPYNIFQNNKKLKNIAFFLADLEIEDGDGMVKLPGTLFVDEYGNKRSELLTVVDGSFCDVKFKFELQPNCFNGSNIESVGYLCAKRETIEDNSVGLYSAIPNDLFRNTDGNGNVKKIIRNMHGAFSGINQILPFFDCDYNLNDMDTVENALKNGYLLENPNYGAGHPKYIWNIFKSNGYHDEYRNAILSCGAYNSPEVAKDGGVDFDECLSSGYNETTKVVDNTFGFAYADTKTYLCPADLLYYNDPKNYTDTSFVVTDIDELFKDSKGIKGTIPPMLFEPIPNIQRLSGIFNSVEILPFKNVTRDNPGIMYPPRLLKKLTKLVDISEMFKNTCIAPCCHISIDMFSNNPRLSNVSGLWRECTWFKSIYEYEFDTYLDPLPFGLFKNNTEITNVSRMFSGSIACIKMNEIFNKSTNTQITTSYNYLSETGELAIGGVVDKFWEFPNILSKNCSGTYGIGSGLNPSYDDIKPYLTNISENEYYNNNIFFINQ